ncbi:MAG: TlpA family protein disulfide reductase [Candidatus Aminicenantes bacterium]|nr:MAG: TlpA family protein disulfide reductase [Candidatus Aminicenantes bacterium]
MIRSAVVVFILLALFIVYQCQQDERDPETLKFAAEYEAIQKRYTEKINNTAPENEPVPVSNNKVKELEELLKKYENKTSSDTAELLKSRLLIEISRFNEANQKVDELINKKSDLTLDAKMAKVQILIGTGETGKALDLFKEIESQLKEDNRRFMGWLYVSLYSKDLKEIETYSRKFLEASDLPGNLSKYKADIYWNLAAIARQKKDVEKAKEMLKKAISVAAAPKTKLVLESQLKQMEFIGKPPLPISADTWINSPPLSQEELKGKVAVIDFWATWSSACRKIIPVLNQEYNKYKKSELVVIGCTKLYGNYQDEIEKKQGLDRTGETALLRQYIKRNQLTFPIAVSHEGYNFEDYKITVIPTIIFIDKYGKIDDITIGAGNPQLIRNKIKKLMEETNGKN